MIKCDVTLCGIISRSAVCKQSSDSSSFISFVVNIPLSGSDGTAADLYVGISAPGDDKTTEKYSTGKKVQISGTMYIRNSGDHTFFNLRAEKIEDISFVTSSETERITGSMRFLGKIKKEIKDHINSKNQKPFQTFSAFSSDKDGENAIGYTWVNFFNPKPLQADWFKPDTYVEVRGELSLRVYKNNISIECRTNNIKQWQLLEKK
ncbi:MAG: hypothetical protein E6507_08460 [Prevotella bivia]|uniref:hypothetical protein n=1 Tax=uncultured Prevotella sp. TaxID=159272 RepID=UPI0028047915|nr:hypothetical protein [uncultured Prevotella sp.]MDU6554882.1 hypothetical protein [Prevotella bivia]